MVRSLQNHKLDSRGFTLLEILVVVIILGVLAALAIPVYTAATENARKQEGLQALTALRDAEQRYFAGKNTYTSAVADLDYDPSTVATGVLKSFNYRLISGATASAWSAKAKRNSVNAPTPCYELNINQIGMQTETPVAGVCADANTTTTATAAS